MSEEKKDDIYPVPLDHTLLPVACGFANAGATCYWNAMLQALITCTPLRTVIEEHDEDPIYLQHPVIQKLRELYALQQTGDIPLAHDAHSTSERENAIMTAKYNMNNASRYAYELWLVIQDYRRNYDKYNPPAEGAKPSTRSVFELGAQQDANEMSMFMLDILDMLPDVIDLFTHIYQVLIYCHKCHDMVSAVQQKELFFAIDPELRTPQKKELSSMDNHRAEEGDLRSYLIKRHGYVSDFCCPKCKIRDEYLQIYRLVRVPAIMMVFSKVYHRKLSTKFVPIMHFPASGQPRVGLRYEAVAQIQHSGGMGGGHYWATARRYDSDDWSTLNDNSVHQTSKKFQPDVNTYGVVYCYVGTEKLPDML